MVLDVGATIPGVEAPASLSEAAFAVDGVPDCSVDLAVAGMVVTSGTVIPEDGHGEGGDPVSAVSRSVRV